MPIPNDGWLDSSDVVPMFPTLVWKLQLKAAFHEPMDERILAALEKQGLSQLYLVRQPFSPGFLGRLNKPWRGEQ